MRRFRARLALTLIAACLPATAHPAGPPRLEAEVLAPGGSSASVDAVTSGSLDAQFGPPARRTGTPGVQWLRLLIPASAAGITAPVLVMREGGGAEAQLYAATPGLVRAVPLTAVLPALRGTADLVFTLPDGMPPGQRLYARVDAHGAPGGETAFRVAPLTEVLARSTAHARMIAFAAGALLAVATAALLVWFVFRERLFVLYGALFGCQALYIAYLSGEGFAWPLLQLARPFGSHAWNVPAALSGAAACLFVREIADLQHYSPRVYRTFGGFAAAFVVLALANGLKAFGFGTLVSAVGNVMFVGTAIFTLVVSFLAWRRGIRAAGWFLVAWLVLEGFTTVAAVRLLLDAAEESETLLYLGLPMSMVSAAVLTALGVADRLRDQQRALTEAERRAQTDALTGVLNRRSLIERLEAACLRARARELPITLLFIDLDHFKAINDTRGHAAGDACLRAVVEPIQAELRQSDVVGRYGGEEFVVVLSSADTAVARGIAERIRDRVARTRVEGFGTPIQLTCSIGVAGSDALGVCGEQLIAHADGAVYEAKNAGRNRVEVALAASA
ncbi:MAG: diguanylate cyclase [Proteobacteria bacterium]|nr:diguanylate cyclase [Pseudomonadota bacterium]